MITYRQAQDIILTQARSFGTEIIGIDEADGRVLAEDILADRDYPPFNRSAMDGYAIRLEDWNKGIREFNIQEIILAGTSPGNELLPGAAFKIMTGAAVPSPANCVIRREDTEESNGRVKLRNESLQILQNIATQGEDLKKGDLAIPALTTCSPAIISTLATIGKANIPVRRLPSVAILTTGDEVKPIGEDISPLEIRNSNYYLIKALLKKWQISPLFSEHIADKKETIREVLKKAFSADIIIMSGGVSAGDADYVPGVLEELGVKKLFHKVAIKPGKPICCGKAPGGTMIFALPGNPFSTFVTFKLFVETYLNASVNNKPLNELHSSFSGKRRKKTSLDEFFPARFNPSGTSVEATALNGSGDIRLGTDAEILALHPAQLDEINTGQLITYFKM